MIHPTVRLAFDGSGIDGSLFTSVTDFARDTRWLNTPVDLWTNTGLGVFAVLMVIGWWNARRAGDREMALAVVAPVAVLTAFAVAEVVKKMVTEVRPCYSLPQDYFVEPCPVRTDYAFPSGHGVTAFATVAALWLLDRRLSMIAAGFAVLEGFTRVYVGAHYPHDVVGAAVLALPIALGVSLLLGRAGVPAVARLRAGALRPAFATAADGHALRAAPPAEPAYASARPGGRTDGLALEFPEAMMVWDCGESLPFGGPFVVRAQEATRAGTEWIERLRPSGPKSAPHTWEEGRDLVRTFVDPATGIPAVAMMAGSMFGGRQGVSYHSYTPQALPLGSRLKELIIDDPVWVRTEDGTLYPAPALDTPGLSWGRADSGTATLASLVGRLLDDCAAPAVTHGREHTNGEPELERTFRIDHKRGKRFSRRELERIRNGD